MNFEQERDGYLISTDKSKLKKDIVCEMIQNTYWASEREKATIIKSIENSLCYGIYDGSIQIAFARVITDYATYAYLCDVIINEAYRGKGIGKWLMECVINNPETSDVKKWRLVTKDAHGLYSRYGFKPLEFPEKDMEYRKV
ncbi:MAG: GNAT family N-acetyltransferase [Bacillota bacterium]